MKDLSKICYNNLFLEQVIIRCDFQEALVTGHIFSDDIVQIILQGFPNRGKPQVVRFGRVNVDVSFGENPSSSTEHQISDGIQIVFCDNEDNKLILSNNMIIFEINNYTTFENIKKHMQPIMEAIFNNNAVQITRTGIRYINHFVSNNVKVKKNFFAKDIASAYETKLPKLKDNIVCIRSMHTAEYRIDDMHLTFRYGMFNPDYPGIMKKNDFVLDYDCCCNDMIADCFNLLEHIDKAHDAIQILFEESITDSLREIYRNE